MLAAIRRPGQCMRFDLTTWGPVATAFAIVAAGWFGLRAKWDGKLLSLLSEELESLRGEVKELRKDLDALRRENDGLLSALRTSEAESKRLAEINTKQAAVILRLERTFALFRGWAEKLANRLRELGEPVPDTPGIEDE